MSVSEKVDAVKKLVGLVLDVIPLIVNCVTEVVALVREVRSDA